MHLCSPDKTRDRQNDASSATNMNRQVNLLQTRLSEATAAIGTVVSQDTKERLVSITANNESAVHENYPPDSFSRIFWDQQKKAALSTSSGMRWHPLIIKHLRHLSSGYYEALRKSGCIALPSQRTLRD
jgi:hypothetical protein